MRDSALPFLAAALVVGCSVPPSRLRREVSDITDLLAAMDRALQEEDFDSAAAKARQIAERGDELCAEVMLGDPLRKTIEEALEKARQVRRDVRRREDRLGESGFAARLEMIAKDALAKAEANTEEPKGPPAGAEAMTLVAAASGGAPDAGDDAPATGGGDDDIERHRAVVQGDRAGDIADDEILTRRQKAAKENAPKKLVIDENTPPVVIQQKPVTKGKGVAAYFTLVNNTDDFQYVVAVNTDFLRDSGGRLGFTNTTFKVEGFTPNWDDIYASKGESLSGDGFAIHAKSGLQLVAVGMKPAVGAVEKVKLEVRMRNDDRVRRATGPGDPDEEEEE